MSTVVSELAGALITSAAPEVLPMIGTLAGKMFGVPAVSRIAAGTVWNLCNKQPSRDVEMREMGRSSRGPLRGRALDRSAPRSSWSNWDDSGVVRLNRTHENNVIRRKQRFVGFMVGGQVAAALTVAVLGLLAKLSVIALTLSPAVLCVIAGVLALNALLSMALASHYKMDRFTQVPLINERNFDRIDMNAPENQSNIDNTLWFGLSSLVAPLACLYHLCDGATTGYDERERYLQNN